MHIAREALSEGCVPPAIGGCLSSASFSGVAGKTILSGSAEAKKRYLQARCGGDPHESFVCVYLNNKHYVVNIEVLFGGPIDGELVYPREVVKRCLCFNAAAVIFTYNQSFSVAEPSEADITVTRRLH